MKILDKRDRREYPMFVKSGKEYHVIREDKYGMAEDFVIPKEHVEVLPKATQPDLLTRIKELSKELGDRVSDENITAEIYGGEPMSQTDQDKKRYYVGSRNGLCEAKKRIDTIIKEQEDKT